MSALATREKIIRDPQPADNLILWLPVFMICGIGAYFLSPVVLHSFYGWLGLIAGIGVTIVTFPMRQFTAWRWVVTFVLAFFIGLLLIQYRVKNTDTVLLNDRVWNMAVTGEIQSFEQAGNKWTIEIKEAHIVDDDKTYVFRLSVRQRDFTPDIGGTISANTSLMPPSSPLVPHSYDFRRHAFFDGISGYGYTTKILSYQKPEAQEGNFLETYRDWLGRKVFAILRQPEAGIVASLLNGQRAGIGRRTSQVLQQSGLYHVISISGLHVSLMAMIVFFTSRLLMALNMNFALNYPIKKIAAFLALLGIIFYMMIVGSSPPTLRSVIMTGMALVAIMLDREPIQMRVVALSALFILCIQPESAIDIGFQMSFCAVIGLVAYYQATRQFWANGFWQRSIFLKALRVLLITIVTSLVATLVTAPLVLYYFQQIPVLSMLSNLLASAPIASMIMPGTFLTYLFAPIPVIGDFAIQLMGWGTSLMMQAGYFTAAMPSAVWRYPAVSLSAVNYMMLGVFMIIAIKHRVRWSGVLPILLGLAFMLSQQQPDFLLMQNRIVLQAEPEKDILLVDGKLGNFEKTLMLQHTGIKKIEDFPCTDDICTLAVKDKTIRLIRTVPALDQACNQPADMILTRFYLDQRCGKTVIVDRHDLDRTGGQAIFLDKKIHFEHVRQGKAWRPWEITHKYQTIDKPWLKH